MPLRNAVLILLAATLLGTAPAPAPTSVPTAIPPALPVAGKLGTPINLFNGKDTAGWVWHGTIADSKIDTTWTVKDGVLHSAAVKSGATGYIETDKEYKNFVLTVE